MRRGDVPGSPHFHDLDVWQRRALLQSPDIRERLAVQGLEAASNSPAEFRSYIASEVRKWAVVIKQAGVVAD